VDPLVGEKSTADDKVVYGAYVCEPLSIVDHGSQSLQPHNFLEAGIIAADLGIEVNYNNIDVSSREDLNNCLL
jgi:hypothetical protein